MSKLSPLIAVLSLAVAGSFNPLMAQTSADTDEALPLQCMIGSPTGGSTGQGQAMVRVPQSKVANFELLGFQSVPCPANALNIPTAGLTLCEQAQREDVVIPTVGTEGGIDLAKACASPAAQAN